MTRSEERLWREIETQGQILEVIARPIQTNSAAPHWLLVIRDVTQQRKIESHVQRQQQLAMVGQLAAGIAHDFNNILAVMLLYSQMALRSPDLPGNLRDRLTIVYQQGQRAAELINQIGRRDLVRALRARGLNKPVLILSGHPPDLQAGDLREAGIVWLQKPLSLERLARSVAAALENP